MGFIDKIINLLAGHDVKKREQALQALLSNEMQTSKAHISEKEQLQSRYEELGVVLTQTQNHLATLNETLFEKEEQLVLSAELIESKDNQLSEKAEEISRLELDIQNLNEEIQRRTNDVEELNRVISEQQSDINTINTLTESLNVTQNSLNDVIEEKNALQTQIESQLEVIAQKESQLSEKAEAISRLELDIQNLNEEIQRRTNDVEELNRVISEQQSDINTINTLTESLNVTQNSLNDVIEEKETLQARFDSQSETIAQKDRQLSEKADEISRLELNIQNLNEDIQRKERIIADLNQSMTEQGSQLNSAIAQLTEERRTKNEIISKNDDFHFQIASLEERIESLKRINSELEDRASRLQHMVGNTPANPLENEPVDEESVKEEPVENEPVDEDSVEEEPVEEEPVEEERRQNRAIRRNSRVDDDIEPIEGPVDLPRIINENISTHRTIEYVYDERNKRILSDDFFRDSSAEEIARVSRKMNEAEISGTPYWTCGMCRNRIKMAHRTYNGRESKFFIHASRNKECPWVRRADSSRDQQEYKQLVDETDLLEVDIESGRKTRSRLLKERIYSLLNSPQSVSIGISDVKMDEVIRSAVPYMKWRRPDITFNYNGQKCVIELQKRAHGLNVIVDKDVFFRLNKIHILWVFGSDSDTSYDYLRNANFQNTMFDNHRNVFIFDKDAQNKSDETDILQLKCNWLNENDYWNFNLEKTGTNGTIVGINELTLDDEYFKPYYFDANEPYFAMHPEAKVLYLSTRKSREELLKDIEEKWTRDRRYETAQAQMHARGQRATVYSAMGLWGFRFNTTTIIQPLFTAQPVDLYNGYYQVRQGDNFGIVDYYGVKVIDWNGFIESDGMLYDAENRRIIFKREDNWGVADQFGNVLIEPGFVDVKCWSKDIYRVKEDYHWGLCNIENEMIADCIYEQIDELMVGRARATKLHPYNRITTVSGYLNEEGKEETTIKNNNLDGTVTYQKFELWGLSNAEGEEILPCKYDGIEHWTGHLYRVKNNNKWGIFNVNNENFVVNFIYDSIGDFTNGEATVIYGSQSKAIDKEGNEVAQRTIPLKDGLKKTMKSGKWGIVDNEDNVIIDHLYEEIGSFRSRLIGVINESLIKLNVRYNYPIKITGRKVKTFTKSYTINVGGVACNLPKSSLRLVGKTESQFFSIDGTCTEIAFTNLVFNQEKYLLRAIKNEQLKNKLSHSDNKEDFADGEQLVGIIETFKSYYKPDGKRRTKAMVKFKDGRESMVPRRFFTAKDRNIEDCQLGDTITLKKIGFDEELDQTIWDIIAVTHKEQESP